MTQKATTADERFLIRLYQIALKKGDSLAPIDFCPVAKLMGVKETALKNMIKHLAQANLIKKVSDNVISLTSRGLTLVQELLSPSAHV